MLQRALLTLLLWTSTGISAQWVLIRTTDGKMLEGHTALRSVALRSEGKAQTLALEKLLSLHSAAPASDAEAARITAGLAAIQGADRKERDAAVEELTSIGLPVLTPLLKTYKDTDQHEPRPLYRLFERIIPSYADGFDRTLSLVRTTGGEALRGQLDDFTVSLQTASGDKQEVPSSKIRMLAVRQKAVKRQAQVHSLRHSTQIEYFDTAVVLSAASKVDAAARGFARLSWETDGWASDPNGLTKPGSPAYKSHLFEGQPFGALVGRVSAAGEVFFVGKKFTKTGLPAGRLTLAINDNRHWQNNLGTYTVTMTVTDAYDVGDAQ